MGALLSVPTFFWTHPSTFTDSDSIEAAPLEGFQPELYGGNWQVAYKTPTWFEDGTSLMDACSPTLQNDSEATYDILDASPLMLNIENRLLDPKTQALEYRITGTAWIVINDNDATDATGVLSKRLELSVLFNNACSNRGTYRIVAYGNLPIESVGRRSEYTYAIVTGRTAAYIWVLVRDVDDLIRDENLRFLQGVISRTLGRHADALRPTPRMRYGVIHMYI